jgi:hypothetical protein
MPSQPSTLSSQPFQQLFDTPVETPGAVGSFGILKGCRKLAGGKARAARRHPRLVSPMVMHPEGVLEPLPGQASVCHPFGVVGFCLTGSGGVAALNPRLMSRKPSACGQQNR